jgi:hypothetical protein
MHACQKLFYLQSSKYANVKSGNQNTAQLRIAQARTHEVSGVLLDYPLPQHVESSAKQSGDGISHHVLLCLSLLYSQTENLQQERL